MMKQGEEEATELLFTTGGGGDEKGNLNEWLSEIFSTGLVGQTLNS